MISSDGERETKALLYFYPPREPSFGEEELSLLSAGGPRLTCPLICRICRGQVREGAPSGSHSFVVVIISFSLTIIIGGGLGSAYLPPHMHVQRGP